MRDSPGRGGDRRAGPPSCGPGVSRGASPTLLRLGEGLGVPLLERLEVRNFLLDKLLAVALALDLGGLLDAAEGLVPAEGRLLGELLAHEAGHLGHLLDGQAALL